MRSMIAVVVAAALSATMLTVPAQAAAPYVPPTVQIDWVTPSHVVPPTTTGTAATLNPQPAAAVWPSAGEVEVALPSARDRVMGAGEQVAVKGMPVSVAGSPARARVHLFDRATTAAAGVKGVLLGLSRADGIPKKGSMRMTVDYGAFAGAYGADWASRLRLVQLPACVLTTPEEPECRGTALPTVNDAQARTLSAPVEVSAENTLFAAEAGPSGGAGNFGATSLQPSATWAAGSNTGEFNWDYPLRTPPGLGGPAPKLSISYSSSAVDGRMSASNNQPSWIGEGFDFWPGFIERRYKPCADDKGNGANNTVPTGDQCWVTENASLSMAGHAGELLKDATNAERWHPRGDDGTYVQHRTSADNGDDNGEWWVVTTTDGTQYWFGGKATSNSTWTVPVAGNHADEPCHTSSFSTSFCTQAWRWNLDHVVDQNGNTMTYVYAKETNKYAKNSMTSAPVDYDRGGYLTRIEYGTRTGSSGAAPMVVDFATADRCITSSCGTHSPLNFPDTPYDLECTGSPCYTTTPTFWTTQRLASVTTKLWTGTAVDYNPVTTWTFTHSFPSPGDGTRAGLVLDRISQTGYTRVTTTVPDVTFAYVQKNNRVDSHLTGDHSPAMNWFRLAQVTSESGARTEITYSGEDCVANTRIPNVNALESNNLRCYPVKWTPPGYANPIWDFFHKYVVDQVHMVDTVTPGQPTKVMQYEYVGDPAWHYTDDEGLIKAEDKTWSVWRGYGAVRTRTGEGATQMLSETRYFRGMNGDHLPSGNRVVSLPAVDMNKDGDTSDPVDVLAVGDDEAFAGMNREVIVYNGQTSAEVSAEVAVPWQSAATAARTINGTVVYARFSGFKETHTRLIRDGGRAPRTTSSLTTFDSFGMPMEVEDRGDESVSTDDMCTLTDYARNIDVNDGDEWLVTPVRRIRQFAVGCARAKQTSSALSKDEVIADRRFYYDWSSDLAVVPTRGLITKTEELLSWVDNVPVYQTASTKDYDANGRVRTSTDVKGNVANTSYVVNAGGQLVRQDQTNNLGWTNSTVLEPAFGLPLSETDPNGRITSAEYDGMARVTAVWRPGRDKGGQSANETYTYVVSRNSPTTVATSKLLPSDSYVTTYDLYDGLLRPRQTQSPRGDGSAGVLVTDVFYDKAGHDWKKYSPYVVAGTPGTLLIEPDEQGDVPQRTESTFDGAGRPLVTVRYVRSPVNGLVEEHSRTISTYGGDRVDQTPPAGGTATSTFTDAHGNTSALWQYHGTTPTPTVAGSYDATTYQYTAKNQLGSVTNVTGKVWSYKYDLHGQRVEATDPNVGTVSSKYNSFGELESTKDARGIELVYTYDGLGRRTGVYNGTVTDANRRAGWFYDELANSRGQMTRSVRWDGGNAYAKEVLGFSPNYQPTAVKFTIPVSETGLGATNGYLYGYTYMADGSPETVQMPDIDGVIGMTSEKLTYEYNSLGKLKAVKTSLDGGTTYLANAAYTGYGEPGTFTLQHNGGSTVTTERTYAEGTRKLTRLLTSRQTAANDLLDVRYEHDQSGNIQKMSDVVSGDHQCFDYDQLRRLTRAWTPGNADCGAAPTTGSLGGPAKYWTAWEFDANGNRSKQTEYVTPTGVKTTTYNHPNEPNRLKSMSTQDDIGTTTRTWDYELGGYVKSRPNGAATQTITWDPDGRVATEDTTSFVYDADGARIIRRDPTGKTLYLPGQELRYTTATSARKTTRFYSNGEQQFAQRTTGGVTWLSDDHQGTTGVTVTATTQAYAIRREDPFGNSRTGVGTWPSTMDKGFVGGTKDNTGLTHLGAREYDPLVGRFISPDPIMDFDDPQQWQTYGYANYSPVTSSDPSGLLKEDAAGGAGTAGGSAATKPANMPIITSDEPTAELELEDYAQKISSQLDFLENVIAVAAVVVSAAIAYYVYVEQYYGKDGWNEHLRRKGKTPQVRADAKQAVKDFRERKFHPPRLSPRFVSGLQKSLGFLKGLGKAAGPIGVVLLVAEASVVTANYFKNLDEGMEYKTATVNWILGLVPDEIKIPGLENDPIGSMLVGMAQPAASIKSLIIDVLDADTSVTLMAQKGVPGVVTLQTPYLTTKIATRR